MIVVLTGPSGSGKSTACQEAVRLARLGGRSVAGLLTLRRFEAGRLTGIDVLDLASGDRRPLAELDRATDGPATDHWHFHRDGIAWGSSRLASPAAADLVLVDELGPLELVRGQGWSGAFDALCAPWVRLGVAVVRPALVERFVEVVGGRAPIEVWPLAEATRDGLPASLVARIGDPA